MSNFSITVPDIGEGIAEVELVEWSANIGETIEEDDVLCVVMTDKATVEIPSPVDGVVTWQACQAGDMIAVGADFVKLQVQGQGNITDEVIAETETETKTEKPISSTSTDIKIDETPIVSSKTKPTNINLNSEISEGAPRAEGQKPLASPAVRQRAMDNGINLNYVHGSGPAGRITHDDLDAFFAGDKSAQISPSSQNMPNEHIEEINIIGLRRKIAAILQDTMQRIPHFTYVEEIDVTELESLRAKLNKERSEEQPKLTMLPFFIKALVVALKDFPEMNARFDDEQSVVYRYGAAHIGIATQTESGLVVPVIKHAEVLDLWQSADEVKRLSTEARNGKLTREELAGSTITITSLGPMGGIATTPVINSPEVAIIGINKMSKRPQWQDGGFVPRDVINISSSFDHRIIDGWEATMFIQRIKSLLESPATLFI